MSSQKNVLGGEKIIFFYLILAGNKVYRQEHQTGRNKARATVTLTFFTTLQPAAGSGATLTASLIVSALLRQHFNEDKALQ